MEARAQEQTHCLPQSRAFARISPAHRSSRVLAASQLQSSWATVSPSYFTNAYLDALVGGGRAQ